MRLPFADQAVISHAKLRDYLLNPDHPHGRGKARFFLGLGFRREEPETLRQELRRLAGGSEMEETSSVFGRKFAGEGEIRAPGGRAVRVVSVWMLPEGKPPPHLVTAYPAEEEGAEHG